MPYPDTGGDAWASPPRVASRSCGRFGTLCSFDHGTEIAAMADPRLRPHKKGTYKYVDRFVAPRPKLE